MAKAVTYQCPNCNGVMTFDAATGHLVCEFCGAVFEQGEAEVDLPVADKDVQRQETTHAQTVSDFLERAPWEVTADGTVGAVVYSCPSCAAEVAADQSVVSTSCPYCGNNMLVAGLATKDNIPQYVLPFSVTKEQAEQRMRQHFEHKWYLSRAFDAQLAHMQGVYVPYHLYDMSVQGRADYIGYYEVSDDDGHDTKYYYAIKRAGHATFTRVPVDGSSKMPDGHMDAIAPFGFDHLQDFSASYAAGFLMEVADEDADECRPRAEQRVRTSFEQDLKADARKERNVEGIEEVVTQETNVRLDNTSSCVLPVWLMHCTWEDVQMLFAVNGETGKCVGDLPVDKRRRTLTIIATVAVLVILSLMLYLFIFIDDEDGFKFLIGAAVLTLIATLMVDGHFMSQMHTAVEATNASMSYDDEGLVVTERWRSKHRYHSIHKARSQL